MARALVTRVDTRSELEDYLHETAWRGLWQAVPGMSPDQLIREIAGVLEPVLAEHVATRERLAVALRRYQGPRPSEARLCSDPNCFLTEVAGPGHLHSPVGR